MTTNISQTEKQSEVQGKQETKDHVVIGKKETPIVDTIEKETNKDRLAKINKVVDDATKFNEDSSENITVKPNVAITVIFPENWYDTYEDLLNYATTVLKKSSGDSIKYAEENYKMKQEMATSTEDNKEYGRTIYKVTMPDCGFPDMEKKLTLSSKKAVEEINKKLKEIALQHEGKILMSIEKEQGATRWDVEWKIEAHPTT